MTESEKYKNEEAIEVNEKRKSISRRNGLDHGCAESALSIGIRFSYNFLSADARVDVLYEHPLRPDPAYR